MTGTTYDVKVGVKKAANRGTFQMQINSTNHGPATDLYQSGSPSFSEVDLGVFLAGRAGDHTFRFTVTGKNSASSNYYLGFDYITLTPQ